MKAMPLKAEFRKEVGKQAVKKIRAQKQIPAVAYGPGINTTPIIVRLDDFLKAIHTKAGENVIIDLTVDGVKNFKKTVVIKEVQYDPVSDAVKHVDFHTISLKEKIKVNVRIHTSGDAIGVKEGGVLDVVHHEIEVECLPTDIPERIDVDISQIKIGGSVHLREVKFSQGVVPTLGEDEVLIAVHAPKIEEVPTPEEEAPTEPELVGKEKKEEGEAEVEAAPKAEEAKKKPAEEQKKK